MNAEECIQEVNMRDRSKLPNDLIGRITSLLTLQYYFRFSAVCQSWFLAAKEKYHSPASQVPWLLLSDSAETKTCNLYNLYEEKLYNAELPGGLFAQSFLQSMYPASVPTILVYTVGRGNFSRTYWSGEASQYSDDDDNSSEDYVLAVMWDSDEGGDASDGENVSLPEPCMRDICIKKAMLSADPTYSEDYVVMVLLRDTGRLALWRPGNLCWLDMTKSGERPGTSM